MMNESAKIFHMKSFAIWMLFLFCAFACNDKPKNPTSVPNQSMENSKKQMESDLKDDDQIILFFGDSLTAGYGLDANESYPSLIQEKIDSLGLKYKVVNGGLSGETTSGGKNRIDWVLQTPVDIFVLALGSNDMLRGLDLRQTKSNVESIIEKVKNSYPSAQILICGMESPPNMGEEYNKSFRHIFTSSAEKYDLDFIPFFLDGVAGIPGLNLPDGKHPNAEGQKIVARNIWHHLREKL